VRAVPVKVNPVRDNFDLFSAKASFNQVLLGAFRDSDCRSFREDPRYRLFK